ncbi:MAG: porin family protein [Bacteroidota bacterium]
MKKILLGLALIASGFAVNAQSFNVGLGGGIFSTWLVNKNVSDRGDDLDFAATFGGQIGLNTAFYFNEKMGVGFGLLYTGHNQKYTGAYYVGNTLIESYEGREKLRYLDIPLLIRFGGGGHGGAYFEMGPQFGILMGAKENVTTTPASTGDYENKDVKTSFNGLNIAALLGFGVDIEAGESVIVTTGLRLGYGTDMTKKYTEDQIDAVADADQLSIATAYAHLDSKDNFHYRSTNRAFGGLYIAVSYKIPTGGSKGTPVPTTK